MEKGTINPTGPKFEEAVANAYEDQEGKAWKYLQGKWKEYIDKESHVLRPDEDLVCVLACVCFRFESVSSQNALPMNLQKMLILGELVYVPWWKLIQALLQSKRGGSTAQKQFSFLGYGHMVDFHRLVGACATVQKEGGPQALQNMAKSLSERDVRGRSGDFLNWSHLSGTGHLGGLGRHPIQYLLTNPVWTCEFVELYGRHWIPIYTCCLSPYCGVSTSANGFS